VVDVRVARARLSTPWPALLRRALVTLLVKRSSHFEVVSGSGVRNMQTVKKKLITTMAESSTETVGSSSSPGIAAIGLVAIAQMASAFFSLEAMSSSTSTTAAVTLRQTHAAIV